MVNDKPLISSCRLVSVMPINLRFGKEPLIIMGMKIVNSAGQKFICVEVVVPSSGAIDYINLQEVFNGNYRIE
jgi:hypothetical protein